MEDLPLSSQTLILWSLRYSRPRTAPAKHSPRQHANRCGEDNVVADIQRDGEIIYLRPGPTLGRQTRQEVIQG